MRVLSVGNMYPPHHLGGYELVWRSATRHLRDGGHRVRVLTTGHREPSAAGAAEDDDVHRELRWYWREHRFPRLSVVDTLRLERHNAAVFDAHVARFRPDVVAWWAMGGMSLSLLGRGAAHGLRGAAFVHDDWVLYGPRVDRSLRLRRRLPVGRSLTGHEVDAWVFVSDWLRRRARKGAWDLGDGAVAPSGIDDALLARSRPAGPWRGRLLSLGRIDERKGVDVAVEALALLRSRATLTVAGDGDPATCRTLRDLAHRSGVGERIRFAGRVPAGEVGAVYEAHDALVFPVRWEEPWGLVPLEAMAVGLPVVATAGGGSAEYLRDGVNALVVPRDDPRAVATAVERLSADPALRERLARGGRRTAERHTASAFNARVAGILERLAG